MPASASRTPGSGDSDRVVYGPLPPRKLGSSVHRSVPSRLLATTYPVQLKVQTAGIADRLALVVPTPQGRCGGVTVRTAQPLAAIVGHLFVRFDGRSIHTVHL